ncbi:unnamed protein product [Brassica napus]|uniref:(rape) hypothetical protein n=1 Tax=Brassica napus TaxID=3708 RepID=A0A816ZDJ7_BRANA|nr:unnamed protein product [Brassica napus]
MSVRGLDGVGVTAASRRKPENLAAKASKSGSEGVTVEREREREGFGRERKVDSEIVWRRRI